MIKFDQELMEQFMRIQWLLSRYFHHHMRNHSPMGFPYSGQGRVLKLLKMKPEIAQKDLSEILGMRPQSIGELLSKLEKKGYITRTPSPDDKRVTIVHLTDKGRDADDFESEQSLSTDIFNCLTKEEQAQLKDYLNRIIKELMNESGGTAEYPRHRARSFPDRSSGFGGMFNGPETGSPRSHDKFFRF